MPTVKIKWSRRQTEWLSLADLGSVPAKIESIDVWTDNDVESRVPYSAKASSSRNRGVVTLCLTYEEAGQSNQLARSEGRWGKTVLKLNLSNRSGTADWLDRDDSQWNVQGRPVEVLGLGKPVTKLRKEVSVIVKVRPKQRELRDALLASDERCALSGESERSAVEAAHIVPVKAGGCEVIENAILLRADLHRLFDAGAIWFNVSSQEATLGHSPGLSATYRKMLANKKLSSGVFARVYRALGMRAKLPGGKGLRN